MPVMGTCAGMIMLSKHAYDRVVGEKAKQQLMGNLDIVDRTKCIWKTERFV